MIQAHIGNPLIEIGYLTIAAFVGKKTREELTLTDLERIADYIEEKYLTPGAWRNFLAGVVFPNSGFAQYAYDKPHLQDRKKAYADSVVRLYRPETPTLDDSRCVFCGRDAVFIATREHVPLLNARGYVNFGPQGEAGLPVCGTCLLAAHALPLGCLIVSGRLLAVYSDDPAVTFAFARQALRNLMPILQMEALEKMPGGKFPRTRLIENLLNLQVTGQTRYSASSLTGYYFTNSGQSAEIDIYDLPSQVVDFILAISHSDGPISRAWEQAIARGRQLGRGKQSEETETTPSLSRNQLYEDIFLLPANAPRFLRRHILPIYSWELTAFFLRKVMNMEQELIQLLHELGRRFAEYTLNEKKGFYFDFVREANFSKWRRHLMRAADDYYRKHNQMLITPDEFIDAFTSPRGEPNNWKLHRDIVALCLIEERIKAGDMPAEDEPTLADAPDTDEEE